MSRAKATKHLTPTERLAKIAGIIEDVDDRCMAVDGPVTPTHQEITAAEILGIYLLAVGRSAPPNPETPTVAGGSRTPQ